jgi:Ca2+-binding EF-hand superfamily protein
MAYCENDERGTERGRRKAYHFADSIAIHTVDFDSFTRVLNRPGGFRDPGEPEEYCRGFQVFDKDLTGFIGVGQFRYILTNLGEKMSDEEVDELLKSVDTSSGELNYVGMLQTFPEVTVGAG